MGCCGSKDGTVSETAPAKPTVIDVSDGKPNVTADDALESARGSEADVKLDPHLEALANNVDFVNTVLQSSFVSTNSGLREQFDQALKETTPEEIQEAEDTYFSESEQANMLSRFGFLDTSSAPVISDRKITWQKGELLGVGAFGRVYMALDVDTGGLLAVKQVTLGGNPTDKSFVEQMRALESEITLLRPLKHENIVRCYGCERVGDELNIFLELVPGGSITSLLQKFGPFPEVMVRVYTRQLLCGLEYLHAHRIIHRDIKGANILVDNTGMVKLADFGASKQLQTVTMTGGAGGEMSLKGTPYWMAPEVIKQTGHGRQADIWSVGCTVIEMLTGKPPWVQFNTQVSALFHIASSKDPPQMPPNISSECRSFTLLCFNRNPKFRPNAAHLLQHGFVRDAKHLPVRHPSDKSLMGSTDLGSSTGSTVSEAPGIGTGTTTGDVLGSTGMSDMGPIEESTEENLPMSPPAHRVALGSAGNSPRGSDKFEDSNSGEMGDTIQQWLTSQAKHTVELSEKLTHSGRGGFNTADIAKAALPADDEGRDSPTGSEGDGEAALHHDDVPIQTMAAQKDVEQRRTTQKTEEQKVASAQADHAQFLAEQEAWRLEQQHEANKP